MTSDDYESFCEVLLGFAEIRGKQLSPAAIELYWRSMQHWPLDAFKAAAEQLLRTSDWMPTPKEFEDLRKAGRMTAGEAWETARKAAGTAIQFGQVTHNGSCGDPFIDSVVRAIGGYGAIAMSDRDKLPFLERRFAEHFEVMLGARDTRDAVPQIAQEGRGFRLPGPTTRLPGPAKANDVVRRIGLEPPPEVAKRLGLDKRSA